MNKEKLLFIINPISGGKNKKEFQSLVQKHLSVAAFQWELKITEYAGHAREITRENLKNFDRIVAVGGDGTINEIAKELVNTSVPMSIIPLGSGNGLARYLGISLNPMSAIQKLHHVHPLKMDTASLNGHFFVSIAGIGFDSLIAAKFNEAKGRGFFNYARLSTQEFFRYQEQNFELILDGQKYNRKAALISFANSNQFGYQTLIAPQADVADGFLDVCILKKPKWYQIPTLMFQIWSGRAHRSSLLEIIKGKEIQVSPNPHPFANVDGESIPVDGNVEVSVNPKSLIIMKPEKY